MEKHCLECNKVIQKPSTESMKVWLSGRHKFCSRLCKTNNSRNKSPSAETRLLLSKALKLAYLEKRKTGFKKGNTGKLSPAYKNGNAKINDLIRHSEKYKIWRMSVYKRDKFTCVNCGYRSKGNKDIRADHIKPFSLYPELRFDVNNGRTLCIPCDLKLGWNYFRQKEMITG
jgi:hypothetical protein